MLLRPGGWLQVVEYQLHIQSDSGRLTDQSAVYRWWQGYVAALSRLNRDPRIGQRLKQFLEAERLQSVQIDYKRLPIGAWSSGAYSNNSFDHVPSWLALNKSTCSCFSCIVDDNIQLTINNSQAPQAYKLT